MTLADRAYDAWQRDGCPMTFDEYLIEFLDAEGYIPNEFAEALPERECDPPDLGKYDDPASDCFIPY